MASTNIVEQLKNKIAAFQTDVKVEKVGTVLEVGDGVARVSGLKDAASMEMLEFSVSRGASSDQANSKAEDAPRLCSAWR